MSAFFVSFGGSAALAAIYRGAQIYNGGNSHRGGERVRKLGCAAQKCDFACAVNYLKCTQKAGGHNSMPARAIYKSLFVYLFAVDCRNAV